MQSRSFEPIICSMFDIYHVEQYISLKPEILESSFQNVFSANIKVNEDEVLLVGGDACFFIYHKNKTT